jgi:hypothetical protein
MSGLIAEVQTAFPPDLAARIQEAGQRYPDLQNLFTDIARYAHGAAGGALAINTKKRKLEDGTPASSALTNGHGLAAIGNPTIAFECKDVSFQVPARKKLKLQLVADSQDKRRQEVRLQNQQTGEVEHVLPADQIDQAFCLPVPEKQQRQWNFVVFPKAGATAVDGTPYEQVVFTTSETKPVGAVSAAYAFTEQDTFVTVTELELNRLLRPQGKHVVIPNAAEFASSIPQPHRKGEKAYHVKAHRGSKEGMVYGTGEIASLLLTRFRLPLLPV